MDLTPDFPAAGSRALWDGTAVQIHQWNIDGSALVFGPGIARRVQPDELSPAEPDGALDGWIRDRVASRGVACFTTTAVLFDDFRAWSRETGEADFRIRSLLTFADALRGRGFASASRPVGMFRPTQQQGFCLTLRRLEVAA